MFYFFYKVKSIQDQVGELAQGNEFKKKIKTLSLPTSETWTGNRRAGGKHFSEKPTISTLA